MWEIVPYWISVLASLFALVILLLVVIFLLCIVVGYTRQLFEYTSMKIYNAGVDRGMSMMKERLMDTSYWYGEHPPTADLLRKILTADNYDCRETWRKEMGFK